MKLFKSNAGRTYCRAVELDVREYKRDGWQIIHRHEPNSAIRRRIIRSVQHTYISNTIILKAK